MELNFFWKKKKKNNNNNKNKMKNLIILMMISIIVSMVVGVSNVCTEKNCVATGAACGLSGCDRSKYGSACDAKCSGTDYCVASSLQQATTRQGTCSSTSDPSGAPCVADDDC